MPGASEDFSAVVLDGLDFARSGRQLHVGVDTSALPRLVEVLVGDSGELDCHVFGEVDGEGNAFLVLEIAGSLALQCQRCLGTVVFPLALASRLLLVPPGHAWPDEELAEDGFDAVEAGRNMALLQLIEDEVLLALPIAPCHEACEPPVGSDEENEPSPFAVLGKLKKGV